MAHRGGGVGLVVSCPTSLQFLPSAAFTRDFNLLINDCDRLDESIDSNCCDAVHAHFVLVMVLVVAALVDLVEQRVGLHAVRVVAVATLQVTLDDVVVGIVKSQSIVTLQVAGRCQFVVFVEKQAAREVGVGVLALSSHGLGLRAAQTQEAIEVLIELRITANER